MNYEVVIYIQNIYTYERREPMGKKYEEDIDVTDIYRTIYKREGITQEELAERFGLASQSGVGIILHRGAKLTHLWKLLNVLDGYRLVVEKVNSKGKVIERYVIGEEKE